MPPIVHEVLRSPGQPLDRQTRMFMESRFGHDFSRVRVHTDARAAASARAVNALAYTVGRDVVFGADRYAPGTSEGRRLLAHELAHVVQQNQSGPESNSESRAEMVAEYVSHGHVAVSGMIGSAPPGLYRNTDEESESSRLSRSTPPVFISWDELLSRGGFQLHVPALTIPPAGRPSLFPGTLGLGIPRQGQRPFGPASLALLSMTRSIPLIPLSGATAAPTTSEPPSLPSRVSLLRSGRFSLGLRLGFPTLEVREMPGEPPSTIAEDLRRAEIIEQFISGEIPTGWDAIDKAKLAKFMWYVFSKHLAPDVASNIVSTLSGSTGPGGFRIELDVVLQTNFDGAGLSISMHF